MPLRETAQQVDFSKVSPRDLVQVFDVIFNMGMVLGAVVAMPLVFLLIWGWRRRVNVSRDRRGCDGD